MTGRVQQQTDMTQGSILPRMIGFTIPLILGNLFQLTYNAVDAMIVGKFLGDGALAAVGTAGPIMNLVILFISGMCMGAGILMSGQFGAGESDRLERQISTTMLGGLGFSLLITAAMAIFAVPVLRLIRVPPEVLPQASAYLRIIFVGLIFTFLYNFFSHTLRALGDSRTPLYFLILSALLNVAGDLLCVVVLDMGVNGAAIATVLSQMASCLCCVIYIKRRVPVLCLGRKWRVFDRTLLVRTVSYGVTSALQLMCVQLGKVFVQAIVNVQGVAMMAAFTAVNRIDDFAMTPQQNIAHGATTFMAQNRGAGQMERVKRGFACGVLIEFVFTAAVSVVAFFLAEPLTRLFLSGDSAEAAAMGTAYVRLISILYFMPGATNIFQGFFRGMGDLKITLISTIANMTARVIAAHYLIEVLHGGFTCLVWSNTIGWIVMTALELPLLIEHFRKLNELKSVPHVSAC